MKGTLLTKLKQLISEEIAGTPQLVGDILDQSSSISIYTQVNAIIQEISDHLWSEYLKTVLTNPLFLYYIRMLGAKMALKLEGYRLVSITLPSGTKIKVKSPFFTHAQKKKRKKSGSNSTRLGSHLALDIVGYSEKIAKNLLHKCVELSALTSSFEIAAQILNREGVSFGANKLRALCTSFMLPASSPQKRATLSLQEGESFVGKRVLVLADGGRVRQRKYKKGAIPKGKKLHGFNSEWKEPKLFTLYVVDDNGRIIQECPPFVDGTTQPLPEFLELLDAYFKETEISKALEVTVLGDGAEWIWKNIPELLEDNGLPRENIHEIIDWSHGVQNLNAALKLLPSNKKKISFDMKRAKNLLFKGDAEGILEMFKSTFKLTEKSKAVKKIEGYFLGNKKRLQYETIRNKKLPIGSGLIESAIRRVINLRLKAPGSFWKLPFAETMLYIRSLLLYGRWEFYLENVGRKLQQDFQEVLSFKLVA